MKYQIVNSRYINEIEDNVNALIEQGWIPQGGIFYYNNNESIAWYYQAMVKPDPDERKKEIREVIEEFWGGKSTITTVSCDPKFYKEPPKPTDNTPMCG